MGRKRKQRRQPHGSAWHWKQTDCWYCTMPGTKKRVPLFDEDGQRIRGRENKEAAELALAKEKLSWEAGDNGMPACNGEWLVARVCSDYIQYCERGMANGTISKGHRDNTVSFLNDLCEYCGALPVVQLRKGHIKTWIESHTRWRSSATHRSVIAIVLAAFNRAEEMYGIANPLKGLKKPASRPRLESLSEKDEKAMYGATEECFRSFLFAAIHTGLRPFCELARITADDVEETDLGMMWRVYSSNTKKPRKIPVRPEVAELARKLMKTAPRGSGLPLLRNTKGRPWKRMTGVVRFIAIKTKLGWDKDAVKTRYSCYSCRHTFAHRMLSGYWADGVGCSIETLAELIGDTPRVAFDHYGKEWGQHYQDPLCAAIGEDTEPNGKEKRRVPLVDESGKRIRGKKNRQAAELALARVKVCGQWRPAPEPAAGDEWLVAKVCSAYIEYCQRGLATDTISNDYCDEVVRRLNQLCNYCGLLPVSQLTKGHVQHWVESHPTWRSPVTRRNAITIVLAAFNHSRDKHDVPHKLKGLKKPPPRPRLQSFSREDEEAIYGATDEPYRDFLFAAIHTGLRPFCELARMTADDVVETERGMMWRVFSSKTQKARKIPVRSEVAEMVRRLVRTAPRGSGVPLFRNTRGGAWKKVTGVGRFRSIRANLAWDEDPVRKSYSTYTCRHTFAHRMLSGFWNGGVRCSIETLAELMGDTPKVVFDHYGREWGQHYQEPLWAAIGAGEREAAG